MVLGQYLALRQKLGPPLYSQTLSPRRQLAGKVSLGGVVAYLVLATAFNVWPGIHPHRKHALIASAKNDIEVPASTPELLLYATSVGIICTGTSLFFLRRLIRSMRAKVAGFAQIGDILLGCIPFYALFYGMVAFVLWLGRVSDLGLSELLENPPMWVMPSFLLWLSVVGGVGYVAALRVEKRRYGVKLTLDPPEA